MKIYLNKNLELILKSKIKLKIKFENEFEKKVR